MDIAGGITNVLPGNLDELRGPYPTLAAACLAIPNNMVSGQSFRLGKFAEIGEGVPYITHWWKDGYEDENLVPYIESSISPLEYKGTYEADDNVPVLLDSTGENGWFYDVVSDGTRNFGSGDIVLKSGDVLKHDGEKWQKIPASDTTQPINVYYEDLDVTKTKYINNGLRSNSFSLNFKGIGLLELGVHYTTLTDGQRGFELIGGLVFGEDDLIVLTAVFASPRENEYSDLVSDITSKIPLIQKGQVGGVATYEQTERLAQKPGAVMSGFTYLEGYLSQDSTKVLGNYDPYTGTPFNATKVTVWKDGTLMDDSKVDNVIYFKNKAEFGGGFIRRDFDGLINVLWFGAKGDKVNDDTIAIQKALDYSSYIAQNSSFGNRVFFPKGNYRISESLILKAGVSIEGEGSNNTWFFNYGTAKSTFKGDVNYIDKGSINYVSLQNLSIYVHATNVNVGNSGIDMIGWRHCSLENIYMDVRAGGDGITCEPTAATTSQFYNMLRNIVIAGSASVGMKGGRGIVLGGSGGQATTWTILGGRVSQCDKGILIRFGGSNTFINVTTEGNNTSVEVGETDSVNISRSNRFMGHYIEGGIDGFNIKNSSFLTYVEAPRVTSLTGIYRQNAGVGTLWFGDNLLSMEPSAENTVSNFNFYHRQTNGQTTNTEKSTYKRHLIEGQNPSVSLRDTTTETNPYAYLRSTNSPTTALWEFISVLADHSSTTSLFKIGTSEISFLLDEIRLGASQLRLHIRAGTPLGNRTAPVGSLALRSDGTIDTTAYLKVSGTGNTGWNPIQVISSGTTANRPTVTTVGYQYFDTTLGKPIWFKSTGVWVDATGTTV